MTGKGDEMTSSRRRRAARWYLASGLAICAGLAVVDDPWRGWLLVALCASAAGATGLAWRRYGGWSNLPATLVAVGAVLLVPAYVLWYPLASDRSVASVPVTDWLFLIAYCGFAVALGLFVRQRASGEHSGWLLDSAIVTVGLGVVAWVFAIQPLSQDESLDLVTRAVAIAYPLVDLALVSLAVRLTLQSGGADGDRLLVGWTGAQLVADLLYATSVLDGTFDLASLQTVAYPVSFVFLGAAALHPRRAVLPDRRPSRGMAARRLLVVTVAALIPPAVLVGLAARGDTDSLPGVAVLCGLLFVLIIARVGLLMVDVATYERSQAELRRAINEERRRMDENRLLVQSLRERQALSERLFRIQRKISTRAPLQEVLDAITQGAAELLGDEVVGLRLVSDDDPELMALVSSVGVDVDVAPELLVLPVGEGLGGLAVAEDRLCIRERYADWEGALGPFVDGGLQAAMAAPVHLEGHPIGSLTVASHRPGRRYSVAEQDTLTAFAEHVSLALNDARTVQAMHGALDRAVHQAMHDALTGLPNRACVYDRTDQALRAGRRSGARTAVLLFDLDRFKEINDTLGHRYGDEVLRQIGPRVVPLLREADTLARLGGDEFCVLLPEVADAEAAEEVARRVGEALVEPFLVDGLQLTVEASCGITVAPDHGTSAEVLLQRADVAMSEAKGSAAPLAVYEPSLDLNTPERLAVLSELRAAIADGQLLLHVQPQAALPSGAVEGVEMLVRWDHPRLGLLAPGRFVPIAEDTGLIKPLTSWVLDASLAQLRAWLDAGVLPDPERFTVAVNLSTRSLLDEGFLDEVVEALHRHRIPAGQLVLEVTETTLMADPTRATRLLLGLAAVGVRFAIDDFGTGYSSLGMLKALPVDQLKIDRSFVAAMHEHVNDATIVRSVVDLGHTLGLHVVAEGVETQAAWDALVGLGCDAAQGYLLARPMTTAAFEQWLAEHRAAEPLAAPTAGA